MPDQRVERKIGYYIGVAARASKNCACIVQETLESFTEHITDKVHVDNPEGTGDAVDRQERLSGYIEDHPLLIERYVNRFRLREQVLMR